MNSYLYRYRPLGDLSIKGLMYDEWYFASVSELNDPIDMQRKLCFSEDNFVNWGSVISTVAKKANIKLSRVSYEKIILSFQSLGEFYYEDLFTNRKLIQKTIENNLIKNIRFDGEKEHDTKIYYESCYLIEAVLNTLTFFQPNTSYSVSLSATSNEMLLWSHYASNHKGFCIIYAPVESELPLKDEEPKSIVSNNEFEIINGGICITEKVIYNDELQALNAFYLLTNEYFFSKPDQKNIDSSYSIMKNQLLTKNKCWEYEKEYRLIISPQYYSLFSQSRGIDPYSRLVHYDFGNVVGIIFGVNMPEKDKEYIRRIINHKRKEITKRNKGNLFNFLFQQAEIKRGDRGISIANLEIYEMDKIYNKSEHPAHYSKLLDEWNLGTGIRKETFRSEPIEIKASLIGPHK